MEKKLFISIALIYSVVTGSVFAGDTLDKMQQTSSNTLSKAKDSVTQTKSAVSDLASKEANLAGQAKSEVSDTLHKIKNIFK